MDSYHDGSGYDRETVRFYDLAHEGAQVRLVAGLVESGAMSVLSGLRPRSLVVLARDQIARDCANLVEALRSPLRAPFVVTSCMPGYIGPLDVVIVVTERGADEHALRALITASGRGAITVLVGPEGGPLIEEAPSDTIVVPSLPTARGASAARIVASMSAVMDLFEEDLLLVERLGHIADAIDEEIEQLSPERDELVNPGRALRASADGHRVVHTGRSAVGRGIAEVVTSQWTAGGIVSASLDFDDLVVALPELKGPESDIFHDPFLDEGSEMLPLKVVVWAEPEPGLPDAVAQDCDEPKLGQLASALRLIVRGRSATVFTERDL